MVKQIPKSKTTDELAALKKIIAQQKLELARLKDANKQQRTEIFQFKKIFDNLPGDVYWKDKDGVWLGVNRTGSESLRRMGFSWDPDEIIGKTDYDLYGKETADEFRKNDLLVIQTGIESTREESAILPSGEKIIQLSTKRPLLDENDQVVGIVGNTVDITYLKKIEDELRLAKEIAEAESKKKSIFMANMSHDIRTPLTGLIAMATLLEEGAHNPIEKEQAQNMLKCSYQLSNLLVAILDDISSGHLKDEDIHKTTFDLRKLIQDLYEFSFLNAQNKKIELKIEIDPLVPQFVVSDYSKLYRVLLNIIGNAIKFTEKGSVVIKVKQQGNVENQVLLKFMVSDTGVGISDDFKDKIFGQFTRETPSYKGTYKGYGLGLHMSQNYVIALGSKIDLESQKGKGSTFFFEVTMDIGKAEDVKDLGPDTVIERPSIRQEAIKPSLSSISNPSAPILSSSSSTKVLIIEDDLLAMQLAEMGVNKAGYSVVKAVTGEEGLELVKNDNYYLILTDIGLPGISGEEFTKCVREWEKSLGMKSIPIIALTGHGGDPNVVKNCLSIGINEVLTKPANPVAIEKILKKYLSQPNASTVKKRPDYWILPEHEEELFQLSDLVLFDSEFGIKCLGSKQIMVTLLPELIDYHVTSSVELKEALKENDWKKIAFVAHRIKGSALTFGATRMGYACSYVGTYYDQGQHTLLDKLYQQMLHVINETKEAVKEYLADQGNDI